MEESYLQNGYNGMVVYNGKETKKYTWSKGNFYLVNEASKKRNPGYPLDSISIMPGCDKYFVDLTENDKKNNKENYNEDDVVKFIVDSIKIQKNKGNEINC